MFFFIQCPLNSKIFHSFDILLWLEFECLCIFYDRHFYCVYFLEVGPASVMVGNMVQGVRLASAQGRDIGVIDDDSDTARKYQFISEILKWRVTTTADHIVFTLFNAKVCNIHFPLYSFNFIKDRYILSRKLF